MSEPPEVGLSESESVQLSVDEWPSSLTVPHATGLNGQTFETECRSLTGEPAVYKNIDQADAGVHADTLANVHLQQCSRAPSCQGGSLTAKLGVGCWLNQSLD